MAILFNGLQFQGWSILFLQSEKQRKFGHPKVYEFYTNGSAKGKLFTTTVHGVSMYLAAEDVARILDILGGWITT